MSAAIHSTTKPISRQFVDLTGRRFGKLVVLGYAGATKQHTKYWNVRCDCSVEKIVAGGNLVRGLSQSCGCGQREATSRNKFIDLTGQQFGRLTVTGFAGMNGAWATWHTLCNCGNAKVVRSGNLRQGITKSCGCLASETISARNKANIKHGASYSSEYRAWRGMKNRCYNPKDTKFPIYGGRGIRVCDRWINSFEAFFADVGKKPTTDHSVDRFPNKDGNYEPGNVRWATYSEQNRNRRSYKRRQKIVRTETANGP